jgi:hypothetical protein
MTTNENDRFAEVESISLQRPLPNELLRIVAMGEKSDQAPVDL